MNVLSVATLVLFGALFVVLCATAKKTAPGTNQCGGCCNYEVRLSSLIPCSKGSAALSTITSITSRQICTSMETKFFVRSCFKLKKSGSALCLGYIELKAHQQQFAAIL